MKFKKSEDNGKKRRNKSLLYCSIHGENNSHTSRACKVRKERASYKENKSMKKRITKISSRNLISCRQKLPTKNPSMKN